MHSAGKIEDRVFGLSASLPPLPLVTRPSNEFDLLSVSVDGSEVAYAQQGRLALPPLVLLHGWGASHQFWRYSLTAFSPRWRVIAPDLTGFGRSEKPKRDYSIPALAMWLDKFLDAMRLPKVVLVAHSMGGMIGLQFALEHPERLSKLVVVNPMVAGPLALPARTKRCLLPGVRRVLYWASRLEPVRAWATDRFSYVGKLDPELARDVIRGTYRSTFDTIASARTIDLREPLKGLQVPTLSIGSDKDEVLAPDQYEMVPTATKVCIPECGHLPMIERPAEFNRAVNDFISPSGH